VTQKTSWFLSCVLSFGLVTGAHADPFIQGKALQDGAGIEVGAIMHGGASEYASTTESLSPSVQGLVIRDRNGFTSRMVIGLVIAVAGAVAQSGPKSIESKSYRSGDYIVTETKTTYYSEAEKAEMQAATSNAIDGLFDAKYADFELHLFSRDRFGMGDASGYKTNFWIGGGDSVAFESGFGFGDVASVVRKDGMPTRVAWKYVGMPFRVSGVLGPLRLAATYEWNWLKYGMTGAERRVHMDEAGEPVVRTVSHPWRLDASTLIMNRLSITGGVTAQQIQKPTLGYFVSAGLHF
jgi:hypothetical protein